jgi:TRAP-type C4-dicarboxylate transport system substrate-binding protein
MLKLYLAILVTTGLFMILVPSSAMAKQVTLKLAHFMPTMHVQHTEVFEVFAKQVEEFSGGTVKIKIYPGGSLGNPKTMVDAIKAGITDIGFVLPAYVPGRFKRSSVFELPFLFDSATHLTKVMYELYDKDFAEEFKDFKVLWFLSSPLSQVMTTQKPILTAEDFKGMTIRTGNGPETNVIKNLGGNPVTLPISELSIALQKGVVQGAIVPYAGLTSYKLIEMVRHISEVNLAGSLMCVLMNKRKWNALSDDAKNAIEKASGRHMGLIAAGAFDKDDKINIEKAKGKIQIHKISAAEMEIIRKINLTILDNWVTEMNDKGIPGQQILNDVQTSAEKNR